MTSRKEKEQIAENTAAEREGNARAAESSEELYLGSAVKELSLKQEKIRSNIAKVGREMVGIINDLEKLKCEFDEITGRFARYNEDAAEKCRNRKDRRKQTTPVKDLEEAKEIKRLNGLIRQQGGTVADFIEGMNIANRTFYQKVEKHLFTMQELNYLRKELSLTDEEFMKLFFT